MMILRSMLFVPGNNWRFIHKACTLPTDAVILDLEDAVPVAEKEAARIFARDAIKMMKSAGINVFVRVNALTTGFTAQDLKAVICKDLDGLMLPKTESKEDIFEAQKLIDDIKREKELEPGDITIIPLIETARGVINAYEIATASKRVIALSFGAVDFTRDMGTTISKEGIELLYARSKIAVAARASGIQAIDTPWIDLADKEGLIRDAKLAHQLGYNGKLLIHPDQIEPVNRVFSPSKEDIDYATKVVKVFEEAKAKGLGATSLEGKMIDFANYHQAKYILSLVEAINKREKMHAQKHIKV